MRYYFNLLLEKMRYKIRERRQAKAPTIYLIVRYAKWCIREYKWTGKYRYDNRIDKKVPLVYYWTDHNGSKDEWLICPITETTTGEIFGWNIDKRQAEITEMWRNIHERINSLKKDEEKIDFFLKL